MDDPNTSITYFRGRDNRIFPFIILVEDDGCIYYKSNLELEFDTISAQKKQNLLEKWKIVYFSNTFGMDDKTLYYQKPIYKADSI